MWALRSRPSSYGRSCALQVLVICIALSVSAWGQTQPRRSPAGVLVGLWDSGVMAEGVSGQQGPVPEARLRTVWIELGAQQPSVLPHLLLPRREGFWRLGLQNHCIEEPHGRDIDPDDPDQHTLRRGTEVTVSSQLWAEPNGKGPYTGDRPPAGSSPSRCVATDVLCVNDWQAVVYWVWPDYVSLGLGQRGECGMHPSWTPGFTVRAIDTLGTPGKIGDILGAATERRLKREYDKAVAERAKKDPACAELARFDPSMWYIERRTSKWIASGWADTHRICGYGLDYAMDADLSTVTGRARSARAVRRSPAEHHRPTTHVETTELDTHVSPDGRWILRRAGSDVSVAAATDHQPTPVFTLGAGETIVMVEWATGAHVVRWAAEVERARRLAESPAIVR